MISPLQGSTNRGEHINHRALPYANDNKAFSLELKTKNNQTNSKQIASLCSQWRNKINAPKGHNINNTGQRPVNKK